VICPHTNADMLSMRIFCSSVSVLLILFSSIESRVADADLLAERAHVTKAPQPRDAQLERRYLATCGFINGDPCKSVLSLLF
jgi:hypothetical protein